MDSRIFGSNVSRSAFPNSTKNVSISSLTTSSSSKDTSATTWSTSACVTVFAIITGGLFNLSVLAIFTSRPTLRFSFGIYLINLLIIDCIIALVYAPFNLLEQLASQWLLGHNACVLRWYLAWVFEGNIILGHFLIAVNRVWAVVFPFSYRIHHSTKVAILLCVSVWILLNILYIPTVIATAGITNSTTEGTPQCTLDVTVIGVWSSLSQILIFDVPILSVILAYPLVCYKSFFSDRKQRVAPQAASEANDTRRRTMVRIVGSEGAQQSESQRAGGSGKGKGGGVGRICGRSITGSRTGLVTLTLMTLNVLICLLPNEAYWTMMMVVETDPPGVFTIAETLQRLTTVFDPILIVLGNSELRQIVANRIHCR
ncbi:hypothetical protein RvY_12528 [Ramazzottius varieornatus]|uniref:G-protein coupled receptors family 1 profile domain-containing protein n=1 Tax=Ramazzottius varieornatus TaxID=947166 RepID=A0A1D1VTJ8_RAMVA|nr:hypothetical protein RvY_12528 [Ramazzottius varieornatus]